MRFNLETLSAPPLLLAVTFTAGVLAGCEDPGVVTPADAAEPYADEQNAAQQDATRQDANEPTATTDPDWEHPPEEPLEPVELSEAQWRERLNEAAYHVLREDGTERAYSGEHWDRKDEGVYRCAGCDLPLYDSSTKFASGTGWPSFYQAIDPDHVGTKTDRRYGMVRTEVHCARCGGHLGHIFEDGPEPTGLRHCINSVALRFEAAEEQDSGE